MKIAGTTRVFYCIADPIAQVRAPELFNHVFAAHGIDAVMVPLQVAPAHLAATLDALLASPTVGGISLSIPHKTMAAGLVANATPLARAADAVNAIRRGADGRIEGALFDGLGFVRSLERVGFDVAGRRVLLIGAGGAASALATALAERGAACIALYDPDHAKAVRVADAVTRTCACESASVPSNDPAGYDLVVNASPLGLRAGDPLPVAVERIEPGAFVYDILMKGQPTPFVRAARARGLSALPGFDMLVQQAPLYLDFFGYPELAEAARQDDAALRALLENEPATASRQAEVAYSTPA